MNLLDAVTRHVTNYKFYNRENSMNSLTLNRQQAEIVIPVSSPSSASHKPQATVDDNGNKNKYGRAIDKMMATYDPNADNGNALTFRSNNLLSLLQNQSYTRSPRRLPRSIGLPTLTTATTATAPTQYAVRIVQSHVCFITLGNLLRTVVTHVRLKEF